MRAAEHLPLRLDPMPDDPAVKGTARGQLGDGALEAVEGPAPVLEHDLEGLVVAAAEAVAGGEGSADFS